MDCSWIVHDAIWSGEIHHLNQSKLMELIITSTGRGQCIYTEDLPLHELGSLTIRRASHVEPTIDGNWQADLSPVNGPVLGPFELRSEAIKAEWLNKRIVLSGLHVISKCDSVY
jgi:hypothetical protein